LLERLEGIPVDLEREILDGVVGAHGVSVVALASPPLQVRAQGVEAVVPFLAGLG
jgi:hypothetical protein